MINIYKKERPTVLAEYVIKSGATVRATARAFGISKSTVHKDLSYKLKLINPGLYQEVKEILDKNKSERHLRGGEATRKKYLKNREKQGTK
jgi:putative DeoR family transcriptional regulator (stage III sporulation protein D)